MRSFDVFDDENKLQLTRKSETRYMLSDKGELFRIVGKWTTKNDMQHYDVEQVCENVRIEIRTDGED